MTVDQAKRYLLCAAKDGERVVHIVEPKPKTIWGGLGNRSGLHSCADMLIREKWEKSGERFVKKLDKLLQLGQKFQIHEFQNINRDRGRWSSVHTIVIN